MRNSIITTSVLVALLYGTAHAQTINARAGEPISTMPSTITTSSLPSLSSGGKVRIMGTVQNVRNRDQFTLSDNQGSVNVFTNGESRVLQGERLTVIGRVDGAAGGNSIAAEQITRGFESSQNGAIAPYAATGSVSVSENAEQYRARQYNQVAPASGYNEYQADHAYDNRPNGLDRGYEPEAPDNIEYQGSQRTKPYYKGMSMNDYNARVQTRFKGQSRIQPEKGFGE